MEPGSVMKPETLRVRFSEEEQALIEISFVASFTDRLPANLPVALRRKLDRRSIHLPTTARRVRGRGGSAGVLRQLDAHALVAASWLI